MTEEQTTVTIDNQHYNRDDLSDALLAHLAHIRFGNEQLQQLQGQLAVAQTAKASYARALAKELPEKKAAANKKKGVVTVDGLKYNLDDFSEAGKAQLANVQFADQEINRLTNQQALMQTARAQYAQAVTEELKSVQPVKAQ